MPSGMDASRRAQAMRLSLVDGAFASVMSALTGGVFLTGFALQVLQAQSQHIGILAGLPTLTSFAHFLGSYLVETTVKRKSLCVLCIGLSRILWLGVVLLPLGLFAPVDTWRVWLLLAIVAMIELDRAEDILDDLDEVTDAWAERSERKVAYLLGILSEPFKRIRDVLRHDD